MKNTKEKVLPQLRTFVVASLLVALAHTVSAFNTPKISVQEVVVSGVVVDEKGIPLLGVSVLEKDTSNGVVADFNGKFSITVSKESSYLVFTYIGYEKREIVVADFPDKTAVKVFMQPDQYKLDEVVLTAYGQESKILQTSSVSNIKAYDIRNIPTSQLSKSLAGRLPGVTIVQNTGFVGGSAYISVRGSANEALYVIDNIVSDKTQFDALSPNEVESISVLKDAAAASIYGARASGGVVVVKTKSGYVSDKVKVNYTGMITGYGLDKPLQDWSAEQELIYINSVAYNKNRAAETPDPNFKPLYDQEAMDFAKTIDYQDINDVIWRTPFSHQHNLDISGGYEKIRYFFVANYNSDKGSYDNTNFNKYTLRAKIDSKISKNLRIGININYNKRVTDRFYWPYDWDNGEGFTVADFYRATFNLTRIYPYYSKIDGTPVKYGDAAAIAVLKNFHFHTGEIINSNNYRNILYNTFNAVLDAEIKITQIEGLSLKFLGNYRQDGKAQKDFIGEFNEAYKVQTKGSEGIDLLKLEPLKIDDEHRALDKYARSLTGIDETFTLYERYQLNGFLNFDRTINNEHYISSFLGVEQYQFTGKSVRGTASDVLSRDNDQILATKSSTDRRYFNGNELDQSRLSYFGKFKYSYKNKYIADFSFRNDGSYIFQKGKQFGFFPSFSAAWVLSKESFFKPVSKFISNLKLRSSYGTTGYDGVDGIKTRIAPFQYQYNYVPSGTYTFEKNTTQALEPVRKIPNPDITWSTNSTINTGLDVGFFNDALTLSLDYFTTNRTDLLVSRVSAIPGTFGSDLPERNIGEQKIQGIDVALNYHKKINTHFSYSIGLNMGYSTDEYVKWPQAEGIPDYQNKIGLPVRRGSVVRGYISKGIIKDQSIIDALPDGYTQHGQKLQLGNVLLEDINGDNYTSGPDGKVDVNDQTLLSKNAAAVLNYGVPINIIWKDFLLDIFIQGVGPYDKFVTTIETTRSGGVFQYGNRPYFQLWTEAYSQEYNPNGKYPAVMNKSTDPTYTGSSSTFWRRNGAYMRLKNITLSYRMPQKIIRPLGIGEFAINLNATNLLTLTSFKEYDPEQSSLDSYPIFKTYSLGLTVSF